jgi:hypothetical protein
MGSWDFREEEKGVRRGGYCSTNPKNIKALFDNRDVEPLFTGEPL